ncbi:MAG: hypothetical protein NZV14_00795 [Bryobacteraceae bacterium]|nr:hypothetical protein [Bryobacteraceae bacterium]MDW8376667.1 hypothetical protein [Bryobacterales bacterium]
MTETQILKHKAAPHAEHPAPNPAVEFHTPTEELVCVQATIPQHLSPRGEKLEDVAGDGKIDAPGG